MLRLFWKLLVTYEYLVPIAQSGVAYARLSKLVAYLRTWNMEGGCAVTRPVIKLMPRQPVKACRVLCPLPMMHLGMVSAYR